MKKHTLCIRSSLGNFFKTLALISSIIAAPSFIHAAPRPNILFVLTDDLGYGDLGALYQNSREFSINRGSPAFITPQLDTLAGEGVALLRHYCPAPVCAPSRASLLTGVHQGHATIRDNQFDKALDDNHTLATVLRQAGYATACIGKWGLQGPGAASEQPGHPLHRGFDYFYGMLSHLSGHYHYPEQMTGNDNQGQPNSVFENFTDVKSGLAKCYSTDLFTARAKKWIVDHRTNDPSRPFFLFLTYTAPHARLDVPTQAYPAGGGLSGGLQWNGTPGSMINTASGTINSWIHPDVATATWDNDANPATAEAAWPDHAKRHATMVRRLDDAVGDLVQTLKDLNIDQSTLIVFTSDNGPHNEAGAGGSITYNPTFFDSFAFLDGIKRDTYEGGIRVPTFARWPGTITANTSDEAPLAFIDWMPTFAELAGIATPARSDGVSLAPTLTGSGTRPPSTVYVEYNVSVSTPSYQEFLASRRGRARGQMQVVFVDGFKGIRTSITSHASPFEVYNTLSDPGERTDLAVSMPWMQQRMSDRVLQLRRAGGGVTRPYDAELIPPAAFSATQPGLTFQAFEQTFPWAPGSIASTPSAQGTSPGIDLSVRTRNDNVAVQYSGLLNVPASGSYTFHLTTDARAFVRLHDAALLDADFGYAGNEVSTTIPLAAGLHPIRISYARGTGGSPLLSLEWSGPGISRQPVPASALSHVVSTDPQAIDDEASTPRNTSVDIPVLLNDLDDGSPQPLAIISVGTPAAGSAIIQGQHIRYTPREDFLGIDRVPYSISDGASTASAEIIVRVIVDDLTLWIPLDEATGTNVRFAGGGLAGTLINVAQPANAWIEGKHGAALRFDGIDDHVLLTGVAPPAGSAPRTIALWARTTAVAGQLQVMFGYGLNNNGERFSFRLDTTTTAWLPRLEVQNGFIVGSTRINDGAWHHLAVIVDDFDGNGTTDVSEARLYVDGIRETVSSSSARAINTAAGTTPLLGASAHANNYHFQGDVDDVRVFARALTDAEIAALATAPRQAWAAWQFRYFASTDRTGLEDSDGDGMADFMEYALATQPHIFSRDPLPTFYGTPTLPGLRFQRPVSAKWVVEYLLQTATNLPEWNDETQVALETLGAVDGHGIETVALRLTEAVTDDRLYLRLKTRGL